MHCLWRGPTIHRPQEAARIRATLGKTLPRPLAWPSHCLWRAAASGAPSEAKAASRQLLRAEKLVVVITTIVVAIMTTDIISKISDIMTTDIMTIVIMTTDITTIVQAVNDSDVVQVKDGLKVRPACFSSKSKSHQEFPCYCLNITL